MKKMVILEFMVRMFAPAQKTCLLMCFWKNNELDEKQSFVAGTYSMVWRDHVQKICLIRFLIEEGLRWYTPMMSYDNWVRCETSCRV
jgi:hypothetical protein